MGKLKNPNLNMNIYNYLPSEIYEKLSRRKARLIYFLNSTNTERKGVFLHSMFRSGSTYLFKKFRENDKFWCYYEPFHHQLAHLKRDNIAVFRYDQVATNRMNHPHLSKPHFFEYTAALKGDTLFSYNPVIAYDDFAKVKHHALTYKYIRNLLISAPISTYPVLQFNRSSLRIKWLKSYFKKSLHIYLLRSPQDQFESYCQAGKVSGNIFLAINVYILLKNPMYGEFFSVYKKLEKIIQLSGNIFGDLEKIARKTDDIPLLLHYEIFLHIWFASLVHGSKYADIIIDMNIIGKNLSYTRGIADEISKFVNIDQDLFEDANLKVYSNYSLDNEGMEEMERIVKRLYETGLKLVDVSYLRNLEI